MIRITCLVKVNHSRRADSRWYTGLVFTGMFICGGQSVHIVNGGVYAYPKSVTKTNCSSYVEVK